MERLCVNCKYYVLETVEEPCLHCFDHSEFVPNKQTMADKIRGMTDIELAEIFCLMNWKMIEYKDCLKWLQSDAKESVI